MRALHYIFLVVWMCPCAFSTSIIVKLEENRILLVADTKVDELRDGKPIADQNSFVNECKIEGLGKVALAIFGYSKFRRTNPLVTVSEWNGIDSFVQLSAIAQDDLVQ